MSKQNAKLNARSGDGEPCWLSIFRDENGLPRMRLKFGIAERDAILSEEDGILQSIRNLLQRLKDFDPAHKITPELESEIIEQGEVFDRLERFKTHDNIGYDS